MDQALIIDGMGRIGRQALLHLCENASINEVVVVDSNPFFTVDKLVYL